MKVAVASLLQVGLSLAILFSGAVFPGAGAAEKEPVSFIELEDYRLYMGTDSGAFAVYHRAGKRWTSYNFPKHLTVKPWVDGHQAGFPEAWSRDKGSKLSPGPIVGFELSDAPIEELVAVDTKGRFCTHKLASPLRRTMKPFLLGDAVLYYIVEGKIYAFSGVTGTWDVLEAPEIPEPKWKDGVGTQPAPETGFDASEHGQISVRLPFGKMTFTAAAGRWKLERKPAAEEVSLPGK